MVFEFLQWLHTVTCKRTFTLNQTDQNQRMSLFTGNYDSIEQPVAHRERCITSINWITMPPSEITKFQLTFPPFSFDELFSSKRFRRIRKTFFTLILPNDYWIKDLLTPCHA